MRCAACSTLLDGDALYCDRCGATLCVPPGPGPAPGSKRAAPPARNGVRALVALAGALLAGGLWWWPMQPTATAEGLQAAMRAAIAVGDPPGRDPVCVANGLAYDREAVNVQTDNAPTLSWMNTLVNAKLYEAPESSVSGGFLSQPILVYKPLPALADWGGARRLCIARGITLMDLTNLGPVDNLRLRGKRYARVWADVRWTLDGPAPWLAEPEVSASLVRELPSWRGAHWQPGAAGWRLVQRQAFVYIDDRWVPAHLADQAPSRANAARSM